MAVRDICKSAGVSERLVFKVKQFLGEATDLKIVHIEGPKVKKLTITAIRHVTTAVERDSEACREK